MKDILTGLDQYEVFLEKLQKEIDQIGDDRIIIEIGRASCRERVTSCG